MNPPPTGSHSGHPRREIAAVVALFGVAAVVALTLLMGLPALSRVDPVSRNVMEHRLRAALCEPRIATKVECLHECARAAGPDYRATACGQLPRKDPTRLDQQKLEMDLWDRSPCARTCQTSWKTHAVWCARSGEPGATHDELAQAVENVKLDAVDACIFEGATMALFDWKVARCRSRCPDSDPDGPRFLTSGDACLVRCLVATLVETPSPKLVRQLDPSLTDESDYAVERMLAPLRESPVPGGFEDVRRRCRLQHTRAIPVEPLEAKRAQEHAFRDCVRAELDALPTR
jgi:hypothetical protein